jgi:hypothetical protein
MVLAVSFSKLLALLPWSPPCQMFHVITFIDSGFCGVQAIRKLIIASKINFFIVFIFSLTVNLIAGKRYSFLL